MGHRASRQVSPRLHELKVSAGEGQRILSRSAKPNMRVVIGETQVEREWLRGVGDSQDLAGNEPGHDRVTGIGAVGLAGLAFRATMPAAACASRWWW
jgi:hypothetical protein